LRDEARIMEEEEEKRKEVQDPRDVIIPVNPGSGLGQDVVDLRKGRPREEKWSYLIALILGIVFVIVLFSLVYLVSF
jgi:hypothetical protein